MPLLRTRLESFSSQIIHNPRTLLVQNPYPLRSLSASEPSTSVSSSSNCKACSQISRCPPQPRFAFRRTLSMPSFVFLKMHDVMPRVLKTSPLSVYVPRALHSRSAPILVAFGSPRKCHGNRLNVLKKMFFSFALDSSSSIQLTKLALKRIKNTVWRECAWSRVVGLFGSKSLQSGRCS